VDIEFQNNDLEKLEADASYDGGYERGVVKAFRKRIQLIRASLDERDFYAMKSLHFEKLKGKRSDQYSMRLNIQWRLIIKLKKEESGKIVVVIDIEDYH
jgi:toxin HigB-1